jgi:predicted permease
VRLPLWKPRQSRQLEEELGAHLDAATRERMERGEPRERAAAAARREFGNVTLVAEVTRDIWGWTWLETFLQDIRYGLRQLRRNPGFTLVGVLTLGLGIGANTAIFSMVNALLLRPLPAANPDELVRFYAVAPDGRLQRNSSYLNYIDYREASGVFSGLTASNLSPVSLQSGEGSEQRMAEVVSGNYFAVLGVNAAHGRTLLESDDRPGAQVVVVSHHLWQNRFAADPQLIGKTLFLNGDAYSVVGIAAEGFPGTFEGLFMDLWVPLEAAAHWISPDALRNRDSPAFRLLGRLQPRVTIPQAQAAMDTVAARLAQTYPDTNRNEGVRLERARFLDGPLRATVAVFMAIVMGFVGLVLLTACANFANLMLARAAARRREFTVRLALGASRLRLVRQQVTEGVLLTALAGIAGLLLANWMTGLLAQFNPLPATIPLRFDFSADARVYLFIAAVSILAGVLLGLAPGAHSSRADLATGLKEESAGAVGGRKGSRLRNTLVVAQLALSLVLLTGATLFLRSLQNAQRMDLGFEPRNAIALDIELKSAGFDEQSAQHFYRQLQQRVEAMPGVQSATLVNLAPLDLATPRADVHIDGHEPPPGQTALKISFNRVGLRYFETLHIPLLSGRDFTERDDQARSGVVIVNETMARRFWPGEDAIGQRVRFASESENRQLAGRNMSSDVLEVIGVARNVKYRTLGEEPEAHMYVPYLQRFDAGRTLVVRGTGNAAAFIPVVQREVETLNKDVRAFFARTLEQHIGLAMLPSRMAATLSGVFGLMALLLATIGLYGLIAYLVAQRGREIGILMALGAQRSDVVKMVLRLGLRLTGAGILAGLAAAFAVTRLLGSLLHGVSASDPLSFGGVTLLLTGVALLACWLPAQRASRIDPMVALRHE